MAESIHMAGLVTFLSGLPASPTLPSSGWWRRGELKGRSLTPCVRLMRVRMFFSDSVRAGLCLLLYLCTCVCVYVFVCVWLFITGLSPVSGCWRHPISNRWIHSSTHTHTLQNVKQPSSARSEHHYLCVCVCVRDVTCTWFDPNE